MSYASNSDVQERLGTALYVQLTDDTGSGVADEAVVTEALRGAQGEMDSYLGRRYAVPVDTAGEETLTGLLKSMALDLAAYRLHLRRPPIPPAVEHKRAAAVEWLSRIASGVLVLPASEELAAARVEGPGAVGRSSPRVLTRDEMEYL